MNIRPNSWHLRLFLLSHVQDRFWIDEGEISKEAAKVVLPEVAAYEEFRREHFSKMSQRDPQSSDYFERLSELGEIASSAAVVWHTEQRSLYTASKSREIQLLLDTDRMSLCPYFWSVFWSVVIYLPFVRGTRPIRNFLSRPMVPEIILGGLFVAPLIAMVVAGAWNQKSEISVPKPAAIVASIKQSAKDIRDDWRKSQEEGRRREQVHLQYEREHPEEIRQQKESETRLHEIENAESWRTFWRDGKEFLIFGFQCASVLAGLALLGTILWFAGKALEWVFVRLAQYFKWGTAEPKPPSTLRLWLRGVMATLTTPFVYLWQSTASFRLFCKETKELIMAFAKAKKEKVCPYLHIQREQNGQIQN